MYYFDYVFKNGYSPFKKAEETPVKPTLCCLNPFAIEKRFLLTNKCIVVETEVLLSQDEINALGVQERLTALALAETHRIVAEIQMEKARIAAEAKAESDRLAAEAQEQENLLDAEDIIYDEGEEELFNDDNSNKAVIEYTKTRLDNLTRSYYDAIITYPILKEIQEEKDNLKKYLQLRESSAKLLAEYKANRRPRTFVSAQAKQNSLAARAKAKQERKAMEYALAKWSFEARYC